MSTFDKKAKDWDKGDIQVQGAKTIAEAIEKNFELSDDMVLMDFGVGTGLLGFEIAKKVQKVYGVDTSRGMLEKLKEKNTPELNIEAIHQDIVATPLDMKFDGLISSMTLHHVENLEKFFTTIKNNLNKNGFLAIADLESEDGTFHSDNEGVHHFGFDKEELCKIVENCGFKNVSFENINTIKKPHREFGVFLLSAEA
ncbi:class I SAM-dependent methyltransferase [Sulfurimonas sp. C5]|uniref:class I SAM-dependent DNA methyltransferase n=1 Tax=Sulfurimonas sp. C5 TaxID=3036947 RepID=UPI0024587095|nr:class I SAM-dependent methyltransferase [Sulfurimonas sp. C5]MDH4943571.1 class I SAM-dependent methyltransferase [Sulfurimonas sp. C5]